MKLTIELDHAECVMLASALSSCPDFSSEDEEVAACVLSRRLLDSDEESGHGISWPRTVEAKARLISTEGFVE